MSLADLCNQCEEQLTCPLAYAQGCLPVAAEPREQTTETNDSAA